MQVTGTYLTGVCKLVYKLSRNEENDELFINSNVPELFLDLGVGRATPTEDCDAMVYGYGALRFLLNTSVNSIQQSDSIAFRLLNQGIIQLLTLHLQLFIENVSIYQYFVMMNCQKPFSQKTISKTFFPKKTN